jgi:hypothetical protein
MCSRWTQLQPRLSCSLLLHPSGARTRGRTRNLKWCLRWWCSPIVQWSNQRLVRPEGVICRGWPRLLPQDRMMFPRHTLRGGLGGKACSCALECREVDLESLDEFGVRIWMCSDICAESWKSLNASHIFGGKQTMKLLHGKNMTVSRSMPSLTAGMKVRKQWASWQGNDCTCYEDECFSA